MAEIKQIKTRLQLKYDTYANWLNDSKIDTGANLVLLKGEIGLCEIPSGSTEAQTAPTVLFKVGDGVKKFSELKWASALAADVYSWAKAETVELYEEIITNDSEIEIGRKQYLRFKTGNDVKRSIDLSIFATDAEVSALVTGINTRLESLEASLGGGSSTGSVSDQLAGLTGRLNNVEAFFESAAKDQFGEDGKKLTNALDTLKEIQDYLEGDGEEASDVISRITKNETDIKNLQDIVKDGGALELRVDSLEAAVENNTSKISTLQALTAGYTGEGAIKNAIEAASQAAATADTKAIAAAQAAAAAQRDIDALKDVVNHEESGLAATKTVADSALTKAEAIETDYLKAADEYIFQCGSSSEVTHAVSNN